MKELIHFAHGNGFPSPCYNQLFHYLEEDFACCYIDRVGHHVDFPVTENWEYLIQEVILSVKAQATVPVIAVGHSLGGILSLLAAIEAPELFKMVILLDSPLLGRLKSNLVRLSKWIGMIDRITPALQTRGRRYHWETREQVVTYLRSKRLFKTFTDACLDDYITYGMNHDEQGFTLRFDRKVEYQIYRTIPHILHHFSEKLRVPSAIIYGNQSNVVNRFDLSYMKNSYGIVNFEIEGTHMFPMEVPKEAADLITKVVDYFNHKKSIK